MKKGETFKLNNYVLTKGEDTLTLSIQDGAFSVTWKNHMSMAAFVEGVVELIGQNEKDGEEDEWEDNKNILHVLFTDIFAVSNVVMADLHSDVFDAITQCLTNVVASEDADEEFVDDMKKVVEMAQETVKEEAEIEKKKPAKRKSAKKKNEK